MQVRPAVKFVVVISVLTKILYKIRSSNINHYSNLNAIILFP